MKSNSLRLDHDFELDGEDYNVEFTAADIVVTREDFDYEFWGFRGHQRSAEFVEDFKVEDLKVMRYSDDAIVEPDAAMLFRLDNMIRNDEDVIEKITEQYLNHNPWAGDRY